MTDTAPYGTWPSPLSAADAAAGSTRIAELQYENDAIYWVERRPEEEGRSVVVELAVAGPHRGRRRDRTPPEQSARTRVHEYGGGSYCVDQGVVYFSNFEDGRIYRQRPGAAAVPITVEDSAAYADLTVDAEHRRLVCVREQYLDDETPAAIVAIALDQTGPVEPRVLVSGRDFYSSPRPSPDGPELAWISWQHPDLPWDATELWRATVDADGSVSDPQRVAGSERQQQISVAEPRWSPDGSLYFVSDPSGWWNLYRHDPEDGPVAIAPDDAEYTYPHWIFGLSSFAVTDSGRIVAARVRNGIWGLTVIHPDRSEPVDVPMAASNVHSLVAAGDDVWFVASGPRTGSSVKVLRRGRRQPETVYSPSTRRLPSPYIAVGEPISFPTTLGETAHAFFYPPTNPDVAAPADESPPLLVLSHGGPTSACDNALDLEIQFWTTRGFAVVDVNYRGSTGYGRAYRSRLDGNWGVFDVDDCIAAADDLAARGLVDGSRLAIRGGSAGGYTTLAALTFTDRFDAGASYYGVGDLETLVRDTHKFESRYLDRLVGRYPEQRNLYLERSPIHHTEHLDCPVIFFQGLRDKVVPPNQAESMVDALRAKGVPVAYVTFEEEGHGFRAADAIVTALESELAFYAQIFGFRPAGDLPEVEIENADALAEPV